MNSCPYLQTARAGLALCDDGFNNDLTRIRMLPAKLSAHNYARLTASH